MSPIAKKILIILSILSIILLVFIFLPGKDSKENKSDTKQTEDSTSLKDGMNNPSSDNSSQIESSSLETPYISGNTENNSYEDFSRSLKTGKVNFIWELWALRRQCPQGYRPGQCDSSILAMIDKKFSSPDNEKVKKLFETYFQYEQDIIKSGLPKDGKFTDRYEEVRKKRRKYYSEEDAKLVFGIEEARFDFMEASANFIKNSANLSGDQRVKKYEEVKREVFGDMYEEMVKREDKFAHYQTELQLRENELSKLKPEEKEKFEYELQIKYFGKEAADKIQQSKKEAQ